ncbi:Glutamate racemase [Levilactobacillus brevis]|nr:Glutamate racemase [Levilactobacillus brevis]
MQNDPIGLMDSGVGGLTVLKEVQRLLPTENTVFLGDQARLPYGPRSVAEVTMFTKQIAQFLRQQAGIKALVIACNTATAAALTTMQQTLPIPVIGVIAPGAQAAVQTTRNHRIGVIATAGTVKSDQYRRDILVSST